LSGSWDLGVVVGATLIGAVADRFSYATGFGVGALFGAFGVCALAFTAARRPVAAPVTNI
jgi:predicted MFS family arabinose efflux permease